MIPRRMKILEIMVLNIITATGRVGLTALIWCMSNVLTDRHQTKNLMLNHIFVPLCLQFSSFQSLSRVRLFATPWTAARQASLSITNFWSLLKLMSIELVMPSNHLLLCCPLLLLPSIFCSIRVISNESVLELVNRHMGSEGGSMDQGQSLGIVRCR